VLIGARAVQGLSAALLSPATLSLLTTTFPEGPERTRAMGAWSATAAAGGVAGALISGIVTNYVSWRWIFFINVPIGLLALATARMVLAADDPSRGRHKLDLLGALISTSGLVALVYGITQTTTHAWGSPRVLIPIAAGALALGTFVIIERRVAAEPILPLGLFKIRSLSAANAAVFLVASSMFATWFFMTLYLQNVLGYDALKAGLAFLPSGFAVIAGTQISARLIERVGVHFLVFVGPLITAGGLLWFAQLPVRGSYATHVLGPSVVTMLGFGIAFVPLTISAVAGVPPDRAGIASGIFQTSRQVGGAVGLAALATIAATKTKAVLAAGPVTHTAVRTALTAGYTRAFVFAAIVAASAAVVGVVAAAPAPGAPSWWRHAISALLGQPWQCERHELEATVQER
jgi:EmrB/QacA subfamily drug resistance transporter